MSTDEVAVRLVLGSLARRIEAATVEAAELERELLGHVHALAPRLPDEPGIGPIVAAHLLVAWSHRGRSPKPTVSRTLAVRVGSGTAANSIGRPLRSTK